MIQNLVVNASRAAKQPDDDVPPRVTLTVKPHGDDRVRIDVTDNGPGVAPDDRDQLFEPFFSKAPAGEGAGLGLAISQGLVESMEGELTYEGEVKPVQSEARPGARFRVSLPAAPPN